MKFTDLKNYKPNEMVKRHSVSIAVHKELYEALSDVKNKKHASKKFQILMLKHFNAKTVTKALNDYDNNNIYAPDYCDYVTVSGYFIQKDYDRFCDIADANKCTVNYCAKILFYWLMQNKVGNSPVVKLPSITNKKSRKRTIRNVNFNHSFTNTKSKTISLTVSKNDKIEINIKID